MIGFVCAYLACTIFGAVNALTHFGYMQARINEVLLQPYPPRDWVVHAVIVMRAFIALAILWWALGRQSVIARIVILGQLAGWLYGAPIAVRILMRGDWRAMPFLLAGTASLIAVAMMLAPAQAAISSSTL